MERVTVEDVPSKSYRGLELFMLVPAVLMGIFGLGIVVLGLMSFGSSSAAAGTAGATSAAGTTGSTADAGIMPVLGSIAILWIFMFLFGLAAAVAIPLFLYFDAGKIADQDLDWEPSQGLYALGGFFLSGLVVWHYLYKRHQYVIDWVDTDAWWYLALMGVGIGILGIVGNVIDPMLMPIGLLGLPMFAIGIYKDATYVRLQSDWHPNPVNHFLAALFTGLIAILGVFYFGYYAYKRHSHVGLV